MNYLLIFLKAPAPGKVKTRLAKSVGFEKAAALYREMAAAIRDEMLGLSDIRIQWVFQPIAPFENLDWLGLGGSPFWLQGEGDLGERLTRTFKRAFDEGAGKVCVIGMDSPGLPKSRIEEAFSSLERADAVAGPVEDGGYYLLGMRRFAPELFAGIDWSTERVLKQTETRAQEAGLSIKRLETYFDVDTIDDFNRWKIQTR